MTAAEAQRRYRARHPFTIRERNRQRYDQNDGALKQREYRRANRERILARRQEFKRGNAEAGTHGRPLSPRVAFQCVGYDDHGVNRHANRCVGTVSLTAGEIREQESEYDKKAGSRTSWGKGQYAPLSWQRGFLDEETGTWRCGRCAMGSFATTQLELRLRDITQTTESIRTGKQRRMIAKEWADVLIPRDAESSKVGSRRTHETVSGKRVSERNRLARAAGALVTAWSRDPLPALTIDMCVFCDRLVISTQSGARCHKRCLGEWASTPAGRCHAQRCRNGEGEPYPFATLARRRGAPRSPDTLKRYFAWAVRKNLGGESLREIARQQQMNFETVRDGVAYILNHLPAPDLVEKRHRTRIELMRA